MSNQPKEKRQVQQVSLGFLADIVRQIRLAWRLLFDPRVPLWVKTIVPASLLYLISPIDLIPDFPLVGLGQLDDLAVLIIGVKLFIELCPPNIVREHMQELMGEANWRVEPEAPAPSSPTPPVVIDAPYEIQKEDEPGAK